MRIAINCRCFLKKQFTGIGRYAYNLVRSLSELDAQNEYFLYAPKDLFDLKRSSPRIAARNFHVKQDLFRQGPDRILGDVDIYHAPAPEVIEVKRAKVVVSVHDLVYRVYPQGHTDSTVEMTDRQLKSIADRADHIICSSESTRRDLTKYFAIPAERVSVIYLGMDLKDFAPLNPTEQEAARKVIAAKGVDEKYLLFVGTLEPRKNLQGILKAFAALKDKKKFSGKLVIIGMKGWLNENLTKLAEELGIKNDVIFPGFVTNEELRFFYGLSEVLLMPSFYEGFGFPIIEAFCIGTPVVTSSVSSCGELAADAALTVDPHSIEDMTLKMDRVLNDEALRRTLRDKGLRRAQDFSFHRTAQQTLELYKQVHEKMRGAMKVSGFTIVRDAVKYDYPVQEAIRSILPVCDEFIVNVGDSEDATVASIEAIKDPKIKIFKRTWDMGQGKTVLSQETNWALAQCRGDWAFYIQADEVVHEQDLNKLKRCMEKYLSDEKIDALRFEWLHFFGSYYRFRDDDGWFQKQDRIIRNNQKIQSIEDAYAFRHTDGTPLKTKKTGCFIYHYGWVHDEPLMRKKFEHLKQLGVVKDPQLSAEAFLYGRLDRFPIYFGSHPQVVAGRIKSHSVTQRDGKNIYAQNWLNLFRWLPIRYKRHRGLIRPTVAKK